MVSREISLLGWVKIHTDKWLTMNAVLSIKLYIFLILLARHAFRVSGKSIDVGGKSIILQANDQHDKKQWLGAFQSLLGVTATKTYRQDNTLNTQPPQQQSEGQTNNLTVASNKSVTRTSSTSSVETTTAIPCIS